MFDDVKMLLGITGNDKDELLELLISHATTEAKEYAGLDSVTPVLKIAIIKMVIFNYNRLGTEGLNSESYSGSSFNYSSDYPDNILRDLNTAKRASGSGRFKVIW